MIWLYHLHMPLYFVEKFTEYPYLQAMKPIVYFSVTE